MSEEVDLLQLRLVGGRLNPESSHACPSHFYGDPSNSVKLSKIRLGVCDTCINQAVSAEGRRCLKDKTISEGIIRCEFFADHRNQSRR